MPAQVYACIIRNLLLIACRNQYSRLNITMNFQSIQRLSISFFTLGLASITSVPFAAAQSTSTPQFKDITNDLYVKEIEQAATAGIVSGFPGQQFRPQDTLTREQLLSIVVNAMPKVELQNPNQGTKPTLPTVPTQVASNPFPDVDKDRWSASSIQYARDLGLIRGYTDGTFRPTRPVTRAELLVMLQAVDRYLVERRGNWDGRDQFSQPDPLPFSDLQQHWARETIRRMSSNCQSGRVATFLNETGTKFAPDTAARRNYAVAAAVRAVRCLNIPRRPPS
jgi:hypothetical protein